MEQSEIVENLKSPVVKKDGKCLSKYCKEKNVFYNTCITGGEV